MSLAPVKNAPVVVTAPVVTEAPAAPVKNTPVVTEPAKKTVVVRDSGIGGLRVGGGLLQGAGGVFGKLLGGTVKVFGFGVKTAGDVFDSETLTKAGKGTMDAGKQVNKDAGELLKNAGKDITSGADEWKDGMFGPGRPVL